MPTPSERFQTASDGFLAQIEAVQPDRWHLPTPCPAWTVRDISCASSTSSDAPSPPCAASKRSRSTEWAVADMGQLPTTEADADLAAAWREIGEGLAQTMDDPACLDVTLPTPMGPTLYRDIIGALPEDVLIHTWDVARAIGGDETLDITLVQHVYEHLKPLDDALRQPWAFGPKTPVPDGADLQTEFLCFVGRWP